MVMAKDYVLNGFGHGPNGAALNVRNRFTGRFDPGMLRPYIETKGPWAGHACADLMVQNANGEWRKKKFKIADLRARGVDSPVFNATTLTRDDWIEIDKAVLRATRLRLTAWSDLRAAKTVGGFDAWSKMTYEYSAMPDYGEVVKDMDATSPGRDDAPVFNLKSVPLPVIHGDLAFPQRLLDVGRAAGMAFDTEGIEQITRRGWEMVEKTLIGTETGVTWGTRNTGPFPVTGTSTEYGYTNFQYRVTKTNLTVPTGANPQAVMQDVQAMIETMNGNGYFGPFVLYHSTPYSIYLNDDYFRSGGTSAVRTVRERLMEIDGITDIRRLDYLTSGYQLLLIDLNSGEFAAIAGMEPRVVQWVERGGMVQKLMCMMIQVPLLRSRYNGVSGLIHATTS